MGTKIKRENPKYLKFKYLGFSKVSEMRLELTRSNDHYPLKVARLPIPPSGHYAVKSLKSSKAWSEKRDSNPRPRPWQGRALPTELFSRMRISVIHCQYFIVLSWSEKRDSNPRPRPWQGRALPTELFSRWATAVFRLRCKGRHIFGTDKISRQKICNIFGAKLPLI